MSLRIIFLVQFSSFALTFSECVRSLPPSPDYLKRAKFFSQDPIGSWEHCLSQSDMKVADKWEANWSKFLEIWDGKILKSSVVSETPPPVLVTPENLLSTNGVLYHIVRDFGSRKSSHVYMAENFDDLRVFKFETNCVALRNNRDCLSCNAIANEEPLLTEFAIAQIVCGKICPAIFDVSPAEIVDEKIDPRLQFGALKLQLGVPSCSRLGATYRFVEEEVVGKSVDKLFSPKMNPIDRAVLAANTFIQTIDLIQQLHDNGFVHGDIHVGNIVERSVDSSSTLDLILIDFGLGKFFPVEIGTEHRVSSNVYAGLAPTLLSRYQIGGFRVTRRDDVYRAFEVFITLVTDFEYVKIFGSHGQFATGIKSNPERVDIVNGFDEYKGIGSIKDALVTAGGNPNLLELWRKIHLYVSTGIEIDERPSYSWLKEAMQITLNELTVYATAETDMIEIDWSNASSDEEDSVSLIQSGSLI